MTLDNPPEREVVVLGTGGHTREIIGMAEEVDGLCVIGCLGPHRDTDRLPVPWLGADAVLGQLPGHVQYLIGIGSGTERRRVDEVAARSGRQPASLIHPAAKVGSRVRLGPGAVVWPGAVLTADIVLGRHVHVNVNVSVGHDAVLQDFVSLLPACSVGGGSEICDSATIGAGATVIDRVCVGHDSFVGAGAVVVGDVPASIAVVGVPARPLSGTSHPMTHNTEGTS
jgi:sugar O-acyltransferase (sialic acid O-acetyltransferase NeuD family)